ncbi:uncharacterized protein LOC128884387 [Hylaeus volcanicus]|uniref:uncharacterized protein LOC128884387 n=1 Tax=Hylaeus volcanicus TaxID=313075 RepID=UPI0023B7922E|nr:uncharacterized protein LOC128884387 [Hylaeus volcanicus]
MGCSASKQQKQTKKSADLSPNGSSKSYDNQVVTDLKNNKFNETQPESTIEKTSQSTHDDKQGEEKTFESGTVNDSANKKTSINSSLSVEEKTQEFIEPKNTVSVTEAEIKATVEVEPETFQESTPSTSHTQVVKDYEGMEDKNSLKSLEPEVVTNDEQTTVNEISRLCSNESLPLQHQTHEKWNASTEETTIENDIQLVSTGNINERNTMIPGSDDDTVASDIAEPEVGVETSNYGESVAAKDKCYNIFYNICKLPPLAFDNEYFPTNWAFQYCRSCPVQMQKKSNKDDLTI